MNLPAVGILHPGAMGAAVAAAARSTGHTVWWASEGRSAATAHRATHASLEDAGSLARLCQTCDILLSVCPPHAAEPLAEAVMQAGFRGLYADLNAIAPERAQRMGARVAAQGAAFVDGGIIGPPAWAPDTTRLYLSGSTAERVAALFAGSPLLPIVLDETIGKASALKMCYAAYTKGSTALLAAVVAAAAALDVQDALAAEWERDAAGFADDTYQRLQRVTAKAWRFSGEMAEIAATLDAAGLPAGFHLAAADLYSRLSGFRDNEPPTLDAVLAALLTPPQP